MSAEATAPEGVPRVGLRAGIIKPLPAQERFLNEMYDRRYLLYGGAAGPGKSHILRWSLVELHRYWYERLGVRNVRSGLFCEDYPTLKDRQVSKIEAEFPEWLGKVKETRTGGLGFYFRPEFCGGYIALRNLDDPSKYASTEFAAIAVDELTKNPRDTFDSLRFRLRWPGISHTPFLAASNPGSIGHGWVKKLWIDRDYTGPDDENLRPEHFEFIPALAGSNPHLPPEYLEQLNSLPEAMRRAMLHGSWDVFSGQVFTEWRRDLHVVAPFRIPDEWTRWVAIDWGFSAPCSVHWFARPPDKSRIYIYRELYAAGVRTAAQAKAIKHYSKDERIRMYLADPAMWARKGGPDTAGDTVADEYAREGIILTKANNDRLAGLNHVHEALSWKELPGTNRLIKPPRLQVFSTCTNLIRTLPALPHDTLNVEDVDTHAEDHAYDSTRYGLMAERRHDTGKTGTVKVEWA